MIRYRSDVLIARPPEAIFPYLIERDKQALWSDVPMRPLTQGQLDKGSRFEIRFGKGPLAATIGLELTAVEPGRLMSWTSFSGPIRWEGEYRLEPEASGATRLSQDGTLTFLGLWRLLEPFVGREIKSAEVKELETLKAIVEGR